MITYSFSSSSYVSYHVPILIITKRRLVAKRQRVYVNAVLKEITNLLHKQD